LTTARKRFFTRYLHITGNRKLVSAAIAVNTPEALLAQASFSCSCIRHSADSVHYHNNGDVVNCNCQIWPSKDSQGHWRWCYSV